MDNINKSFDMTGKVSLITGAGRGIGATCAEVLAQAGSKVILTDILKEEGTAVAENIKQAGGEAMFVFQDVTDEQEWASVIQKTVETYGGLDVVVNNAGIEGINLVENIPLEQWRQVMSVNLDGVFLGTKHAIRAMKPEGIAGKGGSIVNMCSACGLIGCFNAAAYSASKGAVRLFTKVAAVECGQLGYGIRVNSVHPGIIRTELFEKTLPTFVEKGMYASEEEALATYTAMHPIGRIGTTQDVGQAVLYLASDASSFVTGTELVVDGGWTAH
ncbi:glucose 1-dehydrogenase [uncultured Desulfosarcina sp.]|uniref:glucose 1-dehydrogenase n=1 Tax=uncultured Desulfosarcina sp. TaxID=218289 RepID=UPI0029C7C15F|nr:glucose 1-dehydrogenase [uncultured Desulfosarcina sp.]